MVTTTMRLRHALRRVGASVAAAALIGSTVAVAVSTIAAPPAAAAFDSTGYGVNHLTGTLYTVDTVLGTATLVAPGGTLNFKTAGVARQPGSNLAYYVEGTTAVTAGAFRVATFDVVTKVQTTLTGTNAVYLPRIAFRSDGTLWAMEGNAILHQLNTATGAFIGTAITMTTVSASTIVAGGDIAFMPDGTMYIVSGTNLFKAIPTAGVYSTYVLVGATGVGTSLSGLEIGAGGQLYASDVNGSNISAMFSLNSTTGVATLIGTTTGTTISDLTIVPDRPPVAVADSVATPGNTAVTVTVITNDTDPDGDTLTVTSTTNGTNGTVTIVGGKPVYTPTASFVGTDTFTYTISDGNGGTSTATVTVTVANQPPTAVADNVATPGNTAVTVTVLTNDTDPNGDTLTVTSTTNGTNGTVVITGGKPVYTPNASFVGTDTFTYTISDGRGGTSTATVTVTVANQPPVANNDAASTAVNTAVTVTVLTNDTDPNGDTLTVTSTTNGTNGSVVITGGKPVYTPAAGFSGTDTFTYTISDGRGGTSTATVTVSVNPSAVNDSGTTPANTPLSGTTVLSNDIGTGLTVVSNTGPIHGTVSIAANGTYTYTPTAGYSGPDSFTYTARDASGLTSTATVNLIVTPRAIADSGTTVVSTALSGASVLGNDLGTGLTVTSNTNPIHGTISIAANGTYTYTPTAGYSGPDSFTYTATDASGRTSTATVSLSVTPRAVSDSGYTAANTVLNGFTVLVNDLGTSLTVSANTSPIHGTISIAANGTYTYTPAAGYTGPDSFTYTARDSSGQTSIATVNLTVGPGAINDSGTTPANTTLNGTTVLANDVGTGLTVTANTAVTHGTISVAANGTYAYTPTAGYSGPDSFTYTVTDSGGNTGTATVNLTVTPRAIANSGTTQANTALNGTTVLANDLGSGLTVTSNTSPTRGAVSVAANGTYTYTPTAGYSGPDSFTYTVTDSSGQTSTATVSLTVTPKATNDSGTTGSGIVLNGSSVLTNDLGTGLTVTSNTAVAHGTISLAANGTYTYTPTVGYSGPDSFTYTATDSSGQTATATVNLTVTPRAVNDSGTTAANTTLSGSTVLANDMGTALTVTSNSAVAHGTVSVAANGTYTYTPTAGYSGPDSFTYTVTDSAGQTSPATVSLTVTPRAIADSGSTTAGVTLNGSTVLTNDLGTGLTVTSNTNPANGTVTVAANGTYTYVPAVGFSGPNLFTYTVTDSSGQTSTTTVSLIVTPKANNDSASTPANVVLNGTTVLANDLGSSLTVTSNTAPANGTISIAANGTYTYTPTSNYSGLDTFTYTATDSSGRTTSATVTVTVGPVASNDFGTTSVNTVLNGSSVLVNDAGTGLTVTSNTSPTYGTVSMATNGTYTYTPAAGYSGPDSFTYTATDSGGRTTTGAVSLAVTPRAVADSGSTSANTALNGSSVLVNDLGSALTVTSNTSPTHGTVVVAANGTYTYSPTSGYSGNDSFNYTATDSSGQTTTATVSLIVTPTAVADSATTPSNTVLAGPSVLGNDLGTGLTVTSNSAVAHGTISVAANGTYTYTPTLGYSGPDSFTYTATDSAGRTTTATVSIAVTPRAANDSGTTAANTALNGTTVLANDAGTGLTVTSNSSPARGTVVVAANGTYTYTPISGYSGNDSFTYTATDSTGQTTTATVSLIVTPKAANDSATTPANTALNGTSVLANDAGTALAVTMNSSASHGTVSVSADGTYIYTPATNYSGPDSFTYTATDSAGRTTTATVSIAITPVAANDTGTTNTGVALNGASVLTNDAGSGLTVTSNTSPARGNVFVAADGTYTYTPNAGYSGPDSFTYTATDSTGQTTTATVSLAVTPRAANDTATTPADTTLNGASVLTNDAGTGLAVTVNSTPAHGNVSVAANGTYTYTPNVGYSGPDSFTYTATDSAGQTTSATVSLTVTPRAVNDSASTVTGVSVTVAVITNDSGSGLTITSVGAPTAGSGSASIVGSAISFTPAVGFSGLSTFTYSVVDTAGQTASATATVTVTPLAVNDTATVIAGTPYNGSTVLANDLGTGLAVTMNSAAVHGTVIVNPNGTYTYTPAAGYSGNDSFTYTIADGAGSTSTATVTLAVNPVANPDSATTPANVTLTGASVLTNDIGTGLTVSTYSQPTRGTVSVNADGTYSYTPTSNSSGPDSFTYTTTDSAGRTATSTVTLVVTPVANPDSTITSVGTAVTIPNVLGNDSGSGLTVTSNSSPAHGTVSVTGAGAATYTPAAAYSGPDSFTYTATDSFGRTSTTTVSIAVAPRANNDSATVGSDQVLTGASVLANDFGTVLAVTSNSGPAHGTVTVNADGTYVYTPALGYSGFDSFTYVATDSSGQSSAATVTIAVTPRAIDDSAQTTANTAVSITTTAASSLVANDHGLTLTASLVSAPTYGTAIVNGDGTFTYAPTAGFSGNDSFVYRITDGAGQQSSATVSLIVTPLAIDNTATTLAGVTLSGASVLTNDAGTALAVTMNSSAAHGTVTVNADGTYSYVPAANYSGSDSFTYTATDAAGRTTTATVSITVRPRAVADSASTPVGITLNGPSVLNNDLGTVLSVTMNSTAAHGSVTVAADGTYVYVPAGGYSGPDSFTYTATDAFGQTTTATVSIGIGPVAIADSATTSSGVTLNGTSVLANDLGSGLTVTSNSAVAHGAVSVATNGTYTYTPAAGYSGPDSFTYTARDTYGVTTTATVSITVTPRAYADNGITTSGTTLNGPSVLGNDRGSGLTVTSNTGSSYGSVTVNADGTYVYVPAAAFSGTDSFTYTATDSSGQTTTATVTIVVQPVTQNDSATVAAGATFNGSSVLTNDSGTGLTVTSYTSASHGSLTVNPDGTYVYVASANYSGPDSFTYTATDSAGQTTIATVTITVVVRANPDSGSTPAGTTFTGSTVLANDTGSTLAVTSNSSPSHGTVSVASNGTYSYVPAAGYSGPDSFTYTITGADGSTSTATVSMQVTPVAVANAATTPAGITLNGPSVLSNDLGSGLVVTANTNTAQGSLVVFADGTYTYTPAAGFSGNDSFTYTAADSSGQSTTASVSIVVTPRAANDSSSTAANVTLNGSTVLANDFGTGLTVTGNTSPSHGSLTIAADGTYVYVPALNFSGLDTFTYTATDTSGRTTSATVSILVDLVAIDDTGTTASGVTLNGSSVLANDSGVGLSVTSYSQTSHGTVTVASDGTYIYTPAAGFSGIDSFNYTTTDSSFQSATATVSLYVTPKPTNDTSTVAAGATLSGSSVLANDFGTALAVTMNSTALNGTVSVNADGTYLYTPNAGYSGPDVFTYTVTDSAGQTATATVAITVTPVATNNSATTAADTTLNGGSVLADDFGSGLAAAVNSGAVHGTVTVASDGTYVYTPAAGYSGPDSFTYIATDASAQTSTATVSISVTPRAVNDNRSATAGATTNGTSVLTNDSGTGLTVTANSVASHGVVAISSDGTFTYTPTGNYSGPDSFTYTATDTFGQASTATVTLTVYPVALPDTATTAAGVPLVGSSVLANDTGLGLTAALLTLPAHGTVTVNADGTYVYVTDLGYSGPDSFSYRATDASGRVVSSLVSLSITPVANADPATTPGTATLVGTTVLSNDAGTLLSVTMNSSPAHGTVAMNPDGTYVYTPAPGYSGPDSFTYTVTDASGQTATATVTITVTPTVVADSGSTSANTTLNGPSVLANDSGTALAVTMNSGTAHGTVTVNPDGTYVYVPAAGFSGDDSFTYTATDAFGQTATTTVSLVVSPVATNDTGSTSAGFTLNGSTVLANDIGTGLTVTGHSGATNGSVTVNADGTYVYSPAAAFSGTDSFTYTASDTAGRTTTATVTITVSPRAIDDSGATPAGVTLNAASVLGNDLGTGLTVTGHTDPASGTLSIVADGTYVYIPATGFSGPVSFTYTATDGTGQTTTATVTIAVTPTAFADAASTPANVTLNGTTVLANDRGTGLAATLNSGAAHGSVTMSSDGTYVYVPNTGYSGADSFTYAATDASGQTTGATVTITVSDKAVDDSATVLAGTTLTGASVLGNDAGSGLTVTANSAVAHGTVTVNADGTYTYTPAAGYSGTDSFTYTVTDSSGQTSTATVSISVDPATFDDLGSTMAGTVLNGTSVLVNDFGTGLTATLNSTVAHGTVTVNADGTYRYVPAAGYSGPDSFTYTATDAFGHTDTSTVTITVAPVAIADTASTAVGVAVTGNVVTNDLGTLLSVTMNSSAAHGTLVVNPDGTFTYTPAAGYSGPDSFGYTVTDASGQTSTATVSITIASSATADSTTTPANTALSGASVLANDSGSGLTVVSSSSPGHGTVTMNADGTYVYIPAAGYSGPDSFTYVSRDTFGQLATAPVSIAVTPTASNDVAAVSFQTPFVGPSVLANDYGFGLTVTSNTSPAHGTVTVNADGTYVFTPAVGYSGPDSFSYTATDSSGQTATASVSIMVAPRVVADSGTTQANTTLSGSSVLANDGGTGLVVTAYSTVAHGTLTVNSDGTYVFTPATGYSGPDSFSYAATDSFGQSASATVAITVVPVASADTGSTTAGVTLTGSSVLTNDAGFGLTVTSNTTPTHGTVVVNADGSYVYTPAAGYSGPDSFSYTATDASGQTTTASVSITVTPKAVGDSGSTSTGVTLSGTSVLANDSGSALAVTMNSSPAHGTVTVNADGTYLYIPNAGYSGSDLFTYTATDTYGQSATATVSITVATVAVADSYVLSAGATFTGSSVLANDFGSGLTVTSNTSPVHGILVIQPDGTFVYSPAAGYSGPDSLTYTMTDSSGQTSSATVSLTVTPVATADTASTTANTTITGSTVLVNDTGSGLTVTSNTSVAHGSVTVNPDGTYVYVPTAGYSGPDSFTYTVSDTTGQTATTTVSITITPTAADDLISTAVNVAVTGTTVLANDRGTVLAVTLNSGPAHGTVLVNADGTFTYSPATGYSGPDSFTYTATDAFGQAATAAVNVTVTARATDDSYSLPAGAPYSGSTVLANDAGTGLTVTTYNAPSHGTLLVNPDGTFVYTPNSGYSGPDSFTYTTTDSTGQTSSATVMLSVTPVTTPDSATVPAGATLSGSTVIANDTGTGLSVTVNSSSSFGTVTVNADGTYTYTPVAGYSGPDSFSYTVTDAAGQTSTATVSIDVTPVASADTRTTSANTVLTGPNLLSNDLGTLLSVTMNSSAAHGTLVVNPDGTFTYTPSAGYSGPDSFTYTVTDASGQTATATVSILVGIVVVGDSATTTANTALAGASVLVNDSGSGLTVVSNSSPVHGTVTVNADGTYVYTPAAGYSGPDSFTYTVSDTSGGTATATVLIAVTPTASNDVAAASFQTPFVGSSVLANDSGSGLTVTSNTSPAHGTVTVNADGTYVFTPAVGYSGPDSFTYTASDVSGQVVSATVSILVAPRVAADGGSTAANTTLSGASVLANDGGTVLVVTADSAVAHGTVMVNPDGTYLYTPNGGYSGPDSFSYTATDSFGQSGSATVSITVTPVSVADAGSTTAGVTLTGSSVLANDGGFGLTVTSNTAPLHGTVIVNADGTYVYTPAAGYSGPDSFTYSATDASGQTATGSVSITVTPKAVGDTGSTSTGVTLTGSSVLANDAGSGLTVTSNTAPAHGTVVVNADGTYVYTPAAGYSGADSFTYTATDAYGQTVSAPVSITVATVAVADSYLLPAGVSFTGSAVLANDFGSGLTVTSNTSPVHGILVIQPDGTFTYSPAAGYSGPDSFVYTATDSSGQTSSATVSLTVTPVAVADSASTTAGTTMSGSTVLANDTGSALAVTMNSSAAHAIVTMNPDGTYSYVPNAGYSGPDSFTYTVTDATGQTATTTVSITITPTANADSFAAAAGTTLNASSVLSNDLGTLLSVTMNSSAAHGTLVVNPDGTFAYTPATGYSGPDSFTYTVTDASGQTASATVSIVVGIGAVADTGTVVVNGVLAGASLLANDSGTGLVVTSNTTPTHGTVVVNGDGTYIYTPVAGYSGNDSFTYTTTDSSGLTATATVSIAVTPSATSDSGTVIAGSTLTGTSVLTNDAGTALSVTANSTPVNGTVTVNPDGTYSYTPTAGFSGNDTFTYTATDANGRSMTASVIIAVTPNIVADIASGVAGGSLTGTSVLVNDNGSGLTVTANTSPTNGTLTVNVDGTFVYTPATGFSGNDSFTYTATDAAGQTSTATVSITVVPVAVVDSYATAVNTILNAPSVLGNDLGTGLTVTANSSPAHGTVVVNANGTFTYTPTSGYSGTDSFVYVVTDAAGRTASATVDLAIGATAVDDVATTPADSTLNAPSVLANDSGAALAVTGHTAPAHGTLSIAADGTYTYAPGTGYSGPDSFTYTATDGSGQTSTATVTITVTPVAVPDSGSTLSNVAYSGTAVLGNDRGVGLAVTGSTGPLHGTLTVRADGTYIYQSDPGYSGPDAFTYTVTDSAGGTASAAVALTVLPRAVDDAGTAVAGGTLTGASLIANDSGTALAVTMNSSAAHGIVTMNPDGTYSYTPVAGYSGPDSFTYTVTDSSGNTSTATVVIDVRPLANPDSGSTTPNTTLSGPSLLGNDLGTGLTVTSNSTPLHGSLVVNADGTYLYTPAAGYSGPDSFTYTATDASGHATTATVGLTIVPTAADDAASTIAGSAVTIPVLANDNGAGLTVSIPSGPAPGTGTTSVSTGAVVFTPAAGFSGTATFTYLATDSSGQSALATVTVIVNPKAVSDSYYTPVGSSLVGPSVLGNDRGSGLSVTTNSSPSFGTLTMNADGTFLYTPNPAFSGFDTFTYTTTDSSGRSATASVTVAVGTTAVPDTATTAAGTVLNGTSVLANDGGLGLTVTSNTNPTHGSLVMNPDGTYIYTPATGYSGPDNFTYTLTDSSAQTATTMVSLSVTPVATADVATTLAGSVLSAPVLGNDVGSGLTVIANTGPTHGTVSITPSGTFTYTPAAGYSGPDSFTYTTSDSSGQTATATVSLSITPVATSDSASTMAGSPLNGASVLSNDAGTALAVTTNSSPAHGTVTVNSDGTYVYTPSAGYSGSDSFTYTARDASGRTSTATVTIAVRPVAVADSVSALAGQPVAGSLLGNDVGTGLTVASNSSPAHGTVVVNPDGTFMYSPAAGYSGPDSFTYTVTDVAGATATTTVTVAISPVAAPDSGVTQAGTALQGPSLLGNDSGAGLTVTASTSPLHGTVVVNADGTFVYTPAAGFSGTDSFTYTVIDTSGHTSTAMVAITVEALATDDSTTVATGSSVVVSVLANDAGSSLGVAGTTNPTHGSIIVHPDGTITYTPTPGYSGPDSFTYTVLGTDGHPSTATVHVMVMPVGDTAVATTPVSTPIVINVLFGNGSLDATTVKLASAPAHGTVRVNGDGTITYTPEPGYTGQDVLTVTVLDNSGNPVTQTVILTVVGDGSVAQRPLPITGARTFVILEVGSLLALLGLTLFVLGRRRPRRA